MTSTACHLKTHTIHSFFLNLQRNHSIVFLSPTSVEEIELEQYLNSSKITEGSNELMRTQYEWLFINMKVKSLTDNYFGFYQSTIIYTVTMKRRSALYIINFMLPVLFFLCLDLASFLISDSGGEKLSFKVTVLLAVTVLQLILNEILPTSSNRVPLIAVYCIGTFGLMMLSLLETIVVMNLRGRDSALKNNEAHKDQSLSEDCGDKRDSFQNSFKDVNKLIPCGYLCDMSNGELPSEELRLAEKVKTELHFSKSRNVIFNFNLKDFFCFCLFVFDHKKQNSIHSHYTMANNYIL
uniref:Neurotransmitter-gated ion-channel transmembrane domain-containing protein n=1 Tax=Dicentrarchus labrax TaxID=13489 RepID=A0A8P4KAE1_DICLA